MLLRVCGGGLVLVAVAVDAAVAVVVAAAGVSKLAQGKRMNEMMGMEMQTQPQT